MPTGYTADIAKGITFKQYALNCARAFGALVMMRDEPSDAPIPEKFEPSSWHAEQLQNASDKLARLKLMSPAEAEIGAREAYTEAMNYRRTREEERTDQLNKYNAMLAEVVKWQPPTPDHVEYKNFMAKQIRDSIDFDCRSYDEPIERQSGPEWMADQIKRAEHDVEYHTKHHAEEIERTNGRNAWVKALRDALP